ncbi:hypothetical protein AXG93_4201s1240 [Marchantia polymorpha subsp. ruderalis]|uniref:Uncharacterized protein n=1 Tax=Marchantia polymorpha subsp. ruderalis TaxID=1480154 RepID=A0A176WCF1_MARPO|nr:hypothetical protein AXG93_4201s1240 [Marchantia polymorpha subsp. ruderalis]
MCHTTAVLERLVGPRGAFPNADTRRTEGGAAAAAREGPEGERRWLFNACPESDLYRRKGWMAAANQRYRHLSCPTVRVACLSRSPGSRSDAASPSPDRDGRGEEGGRSKGCHINRTDSFPHAMTSGKRFTGGPSGGTAPAAEEGKYAMKQLNRGKASYGARYEDVIRIPVLVLLLLLLLLEVV